MNKELQTTIKYLKKNRGLAIKTILPVVIFCLVVTIIGIYLPKPNDNISPSKEGYLFENRNPKFKVGFGDDTQPDKSYVRFEAKVDNYNPFEEKDRNIWDVVTQPFNKREGFEFGLSKVRFGNTDSDTSRKLQETIGDAIDQMEVENIFTNTEVIEVGRLLGEMDEDTVSKKTVLNKDVYPGIDLEYQILENLGVKEEIIIRDIEEYTANCGTDTECLLPLNEYVFNLKLDKGLKLKESMVQVRGKTETKYYITDSEDNYIAHFLPTFAVDGLGSKTTDVELDIYQTEGDNYEVVVTLETDWLFSEERVFPVRIDPSIVHDTTAEFDTGSDYNTEAVIGPKVILKDRDINYIDENVVGYWKLNESSGSGAYILDSSENGYHGTPTGTAFTEGKFRGGRQFNSTTTNSITIGDLATFEEDIFTIDAFFKKEGSCNFNHCTILSKGSTGYEGYNFAVNNNVLQIRINDGGSEFTEYLNGTTTISDNVWYHAAAVVNSTTNQMKLYLNGKLDATGSFSETITYASAEVKIGNGNSGEDLGFNGVLDEVRFSNIERSNEEISRFYKSNTHGTHTSASLNMQGQTDIESITWNPVGDDTGDAETPYSTTGLVAQWNFNESSGTTAASGGSCGATCNGTLTGYSNTTAQDVVAGSGWTSDNRRWGSGAVMFDGTDDYVNIGSTESLNIYNSPLTLEAWIKLDSISEYGAVIMQRMENAMGSSGYSLELNSNGTVSTYYYYSGSGPTLTSDKKVVDGQWHHIVATYSSTEYSLYIDGVLEKQSSGTYPSEGSSYALDFNIGKFTESPVGYFDGIIDTARVYSRALSESEVFSNYQSGNIEMRYRTSNDGSTWGDWQGGTETSIEDFENPYLHNTADNGLVGYWSMDEISGVNVEDVTSNTNDGTASSGTDIVDGKHGKARRFSGSLERIEIPHHSSLDLSTTDEVTLEAWIFPTGDPASSIGKIINKGWSYYMAHYYDDRIAVDTYHDGISSAGRFYSNSKINRNEWSHIVFTESASGYRKIYINGKLDAEVQGEANIASTTNPVEMAGEGGSSYYYNGVIDEARIYNRVITAAEVQDSWLRGSANPTTVRTSPISNSVEGSNALSIESNGTSIDGNTVGYWKLDESSGSGAYLKDISPYGHNGTPTGTTYVKDGKVNGARNFNGSTDFITVSNSTILNFSDANITVEAWFKLDTLQTGERSIVRKEAQYQLGIVDGNTVRCLVSTSGTTGWTEANDITYQFTADRWYHMAFTYNGSVLRIFVNGKQIGDKRVTGTINTNTNDIAIGANTGGGTNNLDGHIDNVKISRIALSSEEIYDSYMFGKDKYISKLISSTDVSSNSMLPFWIASDTIGENMGLIYGESEYANYEPDENTLGLWHMDNYYFVDSSGYNNDRSSYYGVEYGIQSSNINWIANQWNGAANDGEIDMTCSGGDTACYIVTHSGNTLSTPTINYGVAMQEAAAIQAYIMYSPSLSAQGITPLATNNSDNFVGVRYNDGWEYDDNTAWVSFIPNSSNIIVATLTTGNPAITNLYELDYPSFVKQGKFAGAIDFNGVEDWMELGNLGDPSAGTIEFWMNLDNSNGGPQYLLDGRDTGNWWLLQDYTSGSCVDTEGNICFNGQLEISSKNISNNKWHYVVITANSTETKAYIDGKLVSTGSGLDPSYASVRIGTSFTNTSYLTGLMDEVRISDVVRTPDEIRQTYEVGRRTHPININFKASLQSTNLITSSSDTTFTISEQDYGTSNPIENIDVGEKIVVKENIDGTEYIAQGNVTTVYPETGAVAVSSWDSSSTFPTSGFTVNASVFKWQREYIDIRYPLDEDLNALSRLTFKKTTDLPATFWIDDAKKATYSSDYNASSFTTIEGVQYVQYQPIFTRWDDNPNLDLYLSEVDVSYTGGPAMTQLMRHGKWFDSSGQKNTFWWTDGINHSWTLSYNDTIGTSSGVETNSQTVPSDVTLFIEMTASSGTPAFDLCVEGGFCVSQPGGGGSMTYSASEGQAILYKLYGTPDVHGSVYIREDDTNGRILDTFGYCIGSASYCDSVM